MHELALLKTMMDKDIYDQHKGIRFPDTLFTKDLRKIKQTLEYAMEKYEKSLTTATLEALFYANNGTMTTANKEVFRDLFRKIDRETPLNNDIATDLFISILCHPASGRKAQTMFRKLIQSTRNMNSG